MTDVNQSATQAVTSSLGLRRGDRVRVRSADEILGTLDEHGDLDQLPFMPEMLPLCGQTFEVAARADKTCDTIDLTGCSREMTDTVHLVEARCDGSAHGGCQAGCLFFFKESWLEPAEAPASPQAAHAAQAPPAELVDRLAANTMKDSETYRCQATQLLDASRPMSGMRHYLRDVQTRNAPAPVLAHGLLISLLDRYQRFSRRRLPEWARINGGNEIPDVRGSQTKTPVEHLDLQPGEIVEVRSLPEIIGTLNANQRNRGLWFDREMIRYCGRQFRVLRRVDRLLDEKTGRMIQTTTPSVILEDVVCGGEYHKLCPRRDFAFFREVWLKRPGGAARQTS